MRQIERNEPGPPGRMEEPKNFEIQTEMGVSPTGRSIAKSRPSDKNGVAAMEMTPEEREVRRRFASRELYKDFGPGLEGLQAASANGKDLAHEYNSLRPSDTEKRQAVLKELFGSIGEDVTIEAPVSVAYGKHSQIGDKVFVNFGLMLVDDSEVVIKDEVMIGPNVIISTAGHPIHPTLRSTGYQFSDKIIIEERAWIGAGVVLLPGVTVGYGSVVAAGAVVAGNVPPMTVVGGVPARVIREITEADNRWSYRPPRDLA